MAFFIRKNTERQRKDESGLLDASLMQNLQDRFCDANHVYLSCLSKKNGVITKAYGSREELEYIHRWVNMDMHVSLLHKLIDQNDNQFIEESCKDGMKLCGVVISVGGETAAIWVVIGVMEAVEGEDDDVPEYILRTTPERFYKSLEFLATLSKQMFAVKMEELIAQEAFRKSRSAQTQMEAELKRNETMTSVVRMLESESSFEKVADCILKEVCTYMDISEAMLMVRDSDSKKVTVLCSYVSPENVSAKDKIEGRPVSELPFFNSKPYMISSNSMMPDEFSEFFALMEWRAAIFLPVEVDGGIARYLCFCEKNRERIWEVNDIKFINDVKRIVQSILTKRIAKDSLTSSYASLDAILENVACGIYVKDPVRDVILYMNQRFRDSFRKSMASGTLEQRMAETTGNGRRGYFCEIYSEEEERWFDFHETSIRWIDGREVLLCTIYDITDKKQYEKKIERQENNDLLTGLYNRMRCEQDLERYISITEETGGEGALLSIDLDDFKNINDGLGHQYGDILLKSISNSLQHIAGVENNCYRMGGDEFIIIIAHQSYDMLQEILEEIRLMFTKPWMLNGTDYYCTMSMGVVRFPTDGHTVEDLIKKADLALYGAKCAGKNRIEFYNDSAEAASFKRLDLEKNMRNATLNAFQEFEVYYQPVVDVTGEKSVCVGAEALIRWNSKELGFITPTEFIPLAEYLGLINPIGDYVLREACKSCKKWNDAGFDYKINVNLSVVQLLQNEIVDKVRMALEETQIAPKNLTLEVTESLAVNDMNRMKSILSEIKALGVKVALDDFGTGYSSLNHIREMPIDIIKIDRCFILDIGKDDFSDAFVRMVAELANAICVRVCVEGVETSEQLAALLRTKIHLIQGYYFGRPMPLADFEDQYIKVC